MELIIGTYTKYENGTIKNVDHHEIIAETGTRVLFVDNSYLNYLPENAQNSYPAGTGIGHPQIRGTVCRTNCGYEAKHAYLDSVITYPVVVLGDDNRIYYCNPLNIQVINH